MADTEFAALGYTNTIAATDQILVVRAGVPYRFIGRLPAVQADGRVDIAVPGGASYGLRLIGDFGGGGTADIAPFVVGYANMGFGIRVNGNHRLVVEEAGPVRPGADNFAALGTPAYRWSTIYAATSTISTSDERSKQQIEAIPDAWLDAWGDVEWVRYKFNDAVAAKGEEARWHLGLIAQRVRDAFAARDLDATAIGLLCHDAWPEVPARAAVPAEHDADGNVVVAAQPAQEAVPAGDRWALRYDECHAMEAAYQRRRIAQLEARISALNPHHG